MARLDRPPACTHDHRGLGKADSDSRLPRRTLLSGAVGLLSEEDQSLLVEDDVGKLRDDQLGHGGRA